MIPVKCQWRMDGEFENELFYACPREGEYVMQGDKRYRVCQVQHHKDHRGAFAPRIILQEEIR